MALYARTANPVTIDVPYSVFAQPSLDFFHRFTGYVKEKSEFIAHGFTFAAHLNIHFIQTKKKKEIILRSLCRSKKKKFGRKVVAAAFQWEMLT